MNEDGSNCEDIEQNRVIRESVVVRDLVFIGGVSGSVCKAIG